ncbi:hypothetical protein [Paenibacillus sp. FJAT-26967]|uniref:hypothetical protein n=1 Tax=Paenibacillus sp. FJAT-26967 TaxID=1729690 RepID=UPI0020A5CB74|nr:hypothetical protein [Paenibacillus sp. FJAT-26967]
MGIDPSTKTGFVALGKDGVEVLRAKELTGVGSEDPKRMVYLVDEIMDHLQPEDQICIEGFSHASKGAFVGQQYGIGWLIRAALFRRGLKYIEVSPGQLKKFASGKGNDSKEHLILPIYKSWGFQHKSDNVRDGYVLGKISYHLAHQTESLQKYRREVINAILKTEGAII